MLLGDGPCGSRAPLLCWQEWAEYDPREDRDHRFEGWFQARDCDRVPDAPGALPLLWRGEPVPDGIARAVRALGSETFLYGPHGPSNPLVRLDVDRGVIVHRSRRGHWEVYGYQVGQNGGPATCDVWHDVDHISLREQAIAQMLLAKGIASEVIEVRDAD